MTEAWEAWATVHAAAHMAGRSERTIFRWVDAGFVRKMTARGLVLVRREDVLATELAMFNGQEPTVPEPFQAGSV